VGFGGLIGSARESGKVDGFDRYWVGPYWRREKPLSFGRAALRLGAGADVWIDIAQRCTRMYPLGPLTTGSTGLVGLAVCLSIELIEGTVIVACRAVLLCDISY